MNASARSARLALTFVLFLSATPLFAQNVFDGAPFSADPKALLAAAEKVDAKQQSVVYLLDEAAFSFEADGRTKSVWHEIKRIATEDGVEDAGTIEGWWSPWYDDKPTIAARVIAKDGTVHTLDPKAIVEATADLEEDIFSDQRVLRAPLPGVVAGSIVETLVTVEGRSPIAGGGKYALFNFGAGVDIEHSRLTLDSAGGITPRIVNKTKLQPRTTTENGRTRVVFEQGHSDGIEEYESNLPYDDSNTPYVAFSTGTSWQEIARQYAKIVDGQIGSEDLKDVVAKALGTATDRGEVVTRLLDVINKNVRYAGVEVAEGSIVPRPPKSVLQKKYGDCKDKATLLVAMLRTAGISAHVALLDSGSGFDTSPDLPAMNHFNHVIVVVDKATDKSNDQPELWVDPTDEFARPGQLPLADQGRMALIAADTTIALTRTPEAPSTANRSIETRTFTLPEEGKAHVVEVTTGTWTEDESFRSNYAGVDKKSYKETLEKYATDYYATTKLDKYELGDPHDFTKPFALTLDIAKSKSGIVYNGEADILIPIYDIVSHLPGALRDHQEKTAEAESAKPEKKRTHDFLFPKPIVKEWNYVVIPPPGYAARTLPQNETTKLGTVTLTTEYALRPDGSITAKLVLDSGKRRLTPAEFEETRVAVSKLARRDGVHAGFDSIGQTKLNAGDVGGALAEFRKLALQHPKEAQHHIELARALLAGGLGEAARDEAKRAVTIEPASAKAQAMLATVLEHDILGRPHRRGCDLPGAVAALREAKKLDSTDMYTRGRLAELLTLSADGTKFGKDVPLDKAADEYKSLLKEFGDQATGYHPPYMLVLLHASRWNELKEEIKVEKDVRQRELFRISTTLLTEGSPAAVQLLGSYDAATKRSYAAGVGQTMMAMRHYPESADMFEVAAKGAPNAGETTALVQVLRRTKRYETLLDDSPKMLLFRLIDAMITSDWTRAKSIVLPELLAAAKDQNPNVSFGSQRQEGLDSRTILDLAAGAMDIQQDGDAEKGYRLRARSAVGSEGFARQTLTFYALQRGGKAYFAGDSESPDTIGFVALLLANEGKDEAARQWLNWARESIPGGGGDDPLTGSFFARLWQKEKASATSDEIRIAAAALMSGREDYSDEAVPVLTSLRDKASTDDAKLAVDLALAADYEELQAWAKLLPVAERLSKAHPDSGVAFRWQAKALTRTGKDAEAEALAKERLQRLPKDETAMRALSDAAAKRGDYETAATWCRHLVDDITPSPYDYNHAAWMALFRGKELDRAIEDARRAAGGPVDKTERANSLHTLAALYAEVGKTSEARQSLLKAMDSRSSDEPKSEDWFVLGRIAETYGVQDAAVAAYKRVVKQEPTGTTTWELAQRRMTALGMK